MLSNVMELEYGRRIVRVKDYKQRILTSVGQSLTRLGSDYLDVLICPHNVCSAFEEGAAFGRYGLDRSGGSVGCADFGVIATDVGKDSAWALRNVAIAAVVEGSLNREP